MNHVVPLSDDPFGKDELINKSTIANEVEEASELIFPPQFTPSLSPNSKQGSQKQGGREDREDIKANDEVCEMQKVTNDEDGCTDSQSINMPSQLKSKILNDGFSMIDKFNEVIESDKLWVTQ